MCGIIYSELPYWILCGKLYPPTCPAIDLFCGAELMTLTHGETNPVFEGHLPPTVSASVNHIVPNRN